MGVDNSLAATRYLQIGDRKVTQAFMMCGGALACLAGRKPAVPIVTLSRVLTGASLGLAPSWASTSDESSALSLHGQDTCFANQCLCGRLSAVLMCFTKR